MIIEPDRPGVHDHWIRTGNSLLTAAILHIMYTAPPEEKNLRGVAALLSRPEKGLTETLQEMLETQHIRDEQGVPIAPHPGVVAAVRDVLNKSGDDKSSVVSTVMGYLGIYRDPLLANATSASDFSIDDEYAQLQIKQELKDAWIYFENRQLERPQKKQTKQFSGI
jgi:type IV secretion system protein VirD4